ncbi:hypothetical protein EJ02DRAFT_147980 [Clathrospora elynae]|uniref:Uncharacterized protein n=1 Tax=Clathrospora elynae TaxID=706981 RepID=A0A6A5SR84_9PLEO|nr:hypothetical protein EJ02DRAFT_147980 [Clathrospora elynae]
MRFMGRWTEGHGRGYINSTASPYGSTCSTHQVKAILLFYLPHLFDTLYREPLLLSSYHPSDPDPIHPREPTLHSPNYVPYIEPTSSGRTLQSDGSSHYCVKILFKGKVLLIREPVVRYSSTKAGGLIQIGAAESVI